MKFSVIIVNYASWPLTLTCLASLRRTKYEGLEILVVDNDQEEPPTLPAGVRLIRNRENVGLTRAWNQALAASTGELVVLLNPDTIVKRDFFRRIEAFFAKEAGAGVAGPKIFEADGSLQLSARREINALSGLLGRTSLLTRLFPKSSLVRSQFPALNELDRPTKVDWVSGACIIARRRTLEDISPLDERFFLYFEDADLCRRAREAGWPVYYLPNVEVSHHTGGSSRSHLRAVWLLHQSAFLYHRKHDAHGPLNLYSAVVLIGLTARALVKLVSLAAGITATRIRARRRRVR